ncbi:hypothetical protein E4U60_003425 [Claviceps pazoutovae]|uniref:Uncharacterized protein n=1 Tax=Claviceps pazoutovae TaxID=1649127 RepID=A0A9P7MAA6_9HYPO|nr:hypothetical protein E4U60_003425 [Claviceps pazoutovae]
MQKIDGIQFDAYDATGPINTVSSFIPGILTTTTDVPQEAWRRDLRTIAEDLNYLSVGINPWVKVGQLLLRVLLAALAIIFCDLWLLNSSVVVIRMP